MTISDTEAGRHSDVPTAYSAESSDLSSARGRGGDETKASFKTSEFAVYLIAVLGVLLASYLVKATDGHADYFLADRAWFYVVLLSIGYLVSRGLAKSGTCHRGDV